MHLKFVDIKKHKNLPTQTGRFLLDIVFPKKCYGCSLAGEYICRTCMEAALLPHSMCPHCNRRIPFGDLENDCRKALSINRIFTCSNYSTPLIKKVITDTKYKHAYRLSEPLSELASMWIIEQDLFVDIVSSSPIVIPVPSHIKKQKKRGFNPAEKIGENIAKQLRLQMDSLSLIKTKNTKAQIETFSKKERSKNVKDSFIVQNKDNIRGATILLVDDVITTGSTMKECSITLKKAGAKNVWGLAIAKD